MLEEIVHSYKIQKAFDFKLKKTKQKLKTP